MLDQIQKYLDVALYPDRLTAARPDGRNVAMPIYPQLQNSEKFGGVTNAFYTSAGIFVKAAANRMERLSDIGWKEIAVNELKPFINGTAAILKTTRNRNDELIAMEADFLRRDVDPVRAAEIRGYVRNMRLNDVMQLALSNADVASAILDGRELVGVPDTAIPAIKEALIQNNLIARYAGMYKLQPDLKNLLQSGPDINAAQVAGKQALANYKSAKDEVELAESLVHSALNFAAVVADVSNADIFDLIKEAA